MKIDQSSFRKIATLQRQTSLQSSNPLVNTIAYTDITKIYCEISEYNPISAFFSAAQAGMNEGDAPTHKITCRYSTNLYGYYTEAATNGYNLWVDYMGRKFKVMSVQEMDDMSHRFMTIYLRDVTRK